MSCSNQIICYTSPHLSLHVPFFFLLIILTHCYVIVYSFYYPPLQAYLQYKKSLSNIIHLSHRQIRVFFYFALLLYHTKSRYSTNIYQKSPNLQTINSIACISPSKASRAYSSGSSIAKALSEFCEQGVVLNPSSTLLQSIRNM